MDTPLLRCRVTLLCALALVRVAAQLDPSFYLRSNLVGHFPLDGATDRRVTTFGSVTFGPTGAVDSGGYALATQAGNVGSAAQFPSTGSPGLQLSPVVVPTDDFTVSLWFQLHSQGGGGAGARLVDFQVGDDSTFSLSANAAGRVGWKILSPERTTNGVATDMTAALVPAVNVWYHACAQFDMNGYGSKLWIDGALAASDETPGFGGWNQHGLRGRTTTATALMFAGRGANASLGLPSFHGAIDDVRLFQASDGQICPSIYAVGIGGTPAPPTPAPPPTHVPPTSTPQPQAASSPPTANAAESTGGNTATGAAAAAAGSGAAAGTMQSQAILITMDCASRDTKDVGGKAALVPFRLGGGPAGGLLALWALIAAGVALHAAEALALGPAAVAIHDDGDMVGQAGGV